MTDRNCTGTSRPKNRPGRARLSARPPALAAIGLALALSWTARAADLRLRAECRCSGPVVTLGDVADVSAADCQQAEALAAVELFPAPAAGRKRYLRPRELQDLLILRGVNLLEHRISGADQVVISGGEDDGATPGGPAVTLSVKRTAERRVRQAVLHHLRQHVPEAESWTAEVELNNAQARQIASDGGEVSVRGGMPPWVGVQPFEVAVNSPNGPAWLPVAVRVSVPPSVVVAARSLARGAVVRAGDVQLRQAEAMDDTAEGFHSVDEVIGSETTRAIPAGRIIDSQSVQQPLLVRRGNLVTVYARNAGIRVRTTARAREDGSLGDLVAVESLADRAPFFARVSGVQEVELYARAPRIAEARTVRGPQRFQRKPGLAGADLQQPSVGHAETRTPRPVNPEHRIVYPLP